MRLSHEHNNGSFWNDSIMCVRYLRWSSLFFKFFFFLSNFCYVFSFLYHKVHILFIPVWIEAIVSDHLKVFSTFIYFDIFFILMTVVPPSDHLFVIFIFDDAVFSHGRSGSISGNVVDAIINVIVIIVFFFLFGIDIKDVYKFLFWEKIKDLIHPSLSEFFTGNKRKVLHFIFFAIKSFFANKAVDMGIPFQISAKSM